VRIEIKHNFASWMSTVAHVDIAHNFLTVRNGGAVWLRWRRLRLCGSRARATMSKLDGCIVIAGRNHSPQLSIANG
jgi:hypothetical protein